MRLTKHTDFSLRVLIYLSLQPLGQLVNNNKITKKHLIKLLPTAVNE